MRAQRDLIAATKVVHRASGPLHRRLGIGLVALLLAALSAGPAPAASPHPGGAAIAGPAERAARRRATSPIPNRRWRGPEARWTTFVAAMRSRCARMIAHA